MKSVIVAFLAALSISSFAGTELVGLHSQFQSPVDETIMVLKLSDGRTAFWNTVDVPSVTAEELREHKGKIQVDLDEDHQVLSLNLVDALVEDRPAVNSASVVTEAYKPTILANYKTAQDILASFNRQTIDEAQCYDKAHRWVYEEYIGYATNLMKVFLFFSDSYIARYQFKWWFHAAPFAYVRMNNETTERVLDPTFSQYPLKFKLWTDLFMKNKAECKSITKYSQYVTDLKTDCFLHRATMYFWQPKDLDAFERTGAQKTTFVPWEIDWAYLHGFGVRRPQ